MVVSMNRWKGKVAVVTGASAGIGVAIVEQLVNAGCKVVGIARRKEKVEQQAKKLVGRSGKLIAWKADMTKEDEIIQAFKWVKENVGPIHILVNNAGVMKQSRMIDGSTQVWKDILDTNVLGLSIATREAIKDMRANDVAGHVININSIAGHMVPSQFPGINMYPASKYAVTALTETVRLELAAIKSPIKITSISPGAVTSELAQAGGFEITPELAEMIKNMPFLAAEDIADSVIYVLSTPPGVQVHELTIRPQHK